MTEEELEYVNLVVNNEGFDYAFMNYTDFKDRIKDKEFHKLRKKYIKAQKELAIYIKRDDI